MDYSFEPKARYKEYEYIRRSYRTGMNYTEKVWCKSETAFLKYLSDMNNAEIYSKYYSAKERAMHKEANDICMDDNRVEYLKKRYSEADIRELKMVRKE
jgi:hypothetical protein